MRGMKTTYFVKDFIRKLGLSAIVLGGWALIALAIHLFGYTPEGVVSASPFFCPFKKVTGIDGPGCGMTHAFVALAALNPIRAFEFNPFSIPLFIGITLSAFRVKIPLGRKTITLFYQISIATLLLWWLAARLIPALAVRIPSLF